MSSDVFARFAPFITEYIYRHGWEGLRPVQTEAAHVIFDTDNNLLLSSGTASGKTEAALFPIISLLSEEELSSFGCLYIAPLKSLINDQFGRIDELLDLSGIPVYHWHGDVAASHKTRALREPRGILQITPESLESMLMNRSNVIPRLFGQLRPRQSDNRAALPHRTAYRTSPAQSRTVGDRRRSAHGCGMARCGNGTQDGCAVFSRRAYKMAARARAFL